MRFMMIFKANDESEAGQPPSEEALTAMGLVMAEMAEKGVLLAGDGLLPSSEGFRLQLDKGSRRVVDGPFAETKELIAGYTLIEVRSREEALEWVKRWPAQDGGGSVELELRQVFEAEDFGEEFTPALREQEERLRAKAASN
jgi:hypothetical protein